MFNVERPGRVSFEVRQGLLEQGYGPMFATGHRARTILHGEMSGDRISWSIGGIRTRSHVGTG